MILETNAQYHGNPAVSHSKLEVFRRRPRLYQMRYVTKELPAPEPTAAFRIGSATHCAVLEPEKFPLQYAQRPEGIDRRTKEGKAAWESFTQQHAGKDFLDAEEWQQISAMMEAVRANPLASQLLAQGTPELSWRV
jgi:exodeoxyribonuclease VIII